MPKIISVKREDIVEITRRLLAEGRYDDINARTIAEIANCSVGKLYKLFDNKFDLIANIMFVDWNNIITAVDVNTSLEEGVKNIYFGIFSFSKKYYTYWHNLKEGINEYVSRVKEHEILVAQVSGLFVRLLNFNHLTEEENLIKFISETTIYHASKLDEFETIGKYLLKLF